MVGYAPNGYCLLNITKRKIITSRDVKFDEESFPYKSERTNPEPDNNYLIITESHEQEGEISAPELVKVSDPVLVNECVECEDDFEETILQESADTV